MAWLPGGEKKFENIFIRFRATHEREGQTDGQTPHRSIYRAYAYASRGKNAKIPAGANRAQTVTVIRANFTAVTVKPRTITNTNRFTCV